MADVTTIKQWIRCICGHARGRASEPREDCPECGWAPGTHRPPVKVMHLDIDPCTRYAPGEAPRG